MFILRIFFSGLIAFVPSEDGKQLTVLLLNTPHAHHENVRSGMQEHKPMLLARAAGCEPKCPRTDLTVSDFLFPETKGSRGADALSKAIGQGVVWQLSGSNLTLDIPRNGVSLVRSVSADKSVPDNEAERADFGWVASLKKIDPAMTALRPALFSAQPPEELIAARLTLTSGKVSTYSLIRVNGEVAPIEFRPISSNDTVYTRAAAGWVMAEIQVPGDSLKIVEERFRGGKKRTVTLKPIEGGIDMAILNISSPAGRNPVVTPGAGTHFARFWDLTTRPPAATQRAIPQVAKSEGKTRNFEALHTGRSEKASKLLATVFPGDRTPYDQLLCPMSQIP